MQHATTEVAKPSKNNFGNCYNNIYACWKNLTKDFSVNSQILRSSNVHNYNDDEMIMMIMMMHDNDDDDNVPQSGSSTETKQL